MTSGIGPKVATPIVMVGGPFSSAMRGERAGSTFDSDMRSALEAVIVAAQQLGFEVRSAHRADSYGSSFDLDSIVARDLAWVGECDVFVALFPPSPDATLRRSDGTFVELGHALALRKRVLFVRSSDELSRASYFLQGLASIALVTHVEWSEFADEVQDRLLAEVTGGLRLVEVDTRPRQFVTDPRIAFEILTSEHEAHEVEVAGTSLLVLPGVLSPRVSHSPDFFAEHWRIRPGEAVLDLGCGSGVLTALAARAGAAHVLALDSNPRAVENTKINVARLGLSNVTVREGDCYSPVTSGEQFDVVILSPPFWDRKATTALEASCFDEGHGFLRRCLLGARRVLSPGGRVVVVFSDQGDTDRLMAFSAEGGLVARRVSVGRPSVPGHHVRLFFEFVAAMSQ